MLVFRPRVSANPIIKSTAIAMVRSGSAHPFLAAPPKQVSVKIEVLSVG